MSASLGLLMLRVVLGVTFIAHGWQKFHTWTIAGTAGNFAQMGVPAADLAAHAATWLELIGGIALLLGLFSRLAGLLLGLEMLGALSFAHASAGFFVENGGFEFVLLLAAASFAVFLAGPGRLALGGGFQNSRGWGTLA